MNAFLGALALGAAILFVVWMKQFVDRHADPVIHPPDLIETHTLHWYDV